MKNGPSNPTLTSHSACLAVARVGVRTCRIPAAVAEAARAYGSWAFCAVAEVKHSADEVIKAIRQSSGIKTLIARRLGVHRNSLQNYLKRWPAARAAFDEEVDTVGDMAEEVIIRRLRGGDLKVCKWYAMVRLRHRGYGNSRDDRGQPAEPIRFIKIDGTMRPRVE